MNREIINGREDKSAQDIVEQPNPDPRPALNPAPAYIPACGTLCDAFWWARRGTPAKSAD
jgi:hypothetical protein